MPALKFTVQGLQQATAAQERIRRGLAAQGEEVKKVTLSTAELGRISTKVSKDTESAQQRLIRLLDQAKQAYKNGSLGAKEWEREQVRLNDSFNNSTGEFRKFDEQSKNTFGQQGLSRLAAYAGGIVSISKAIALVTQELEARQALVDRSANVQTSLVQARSLLNQNLVGVSDPERARIRQQFEGVTTGLNLSPDVGVIAGAGALSATGGNVGRALSAVQFASQFNRVNPQNIPAAANALGDILAVLNTDDAQQAFGLQSAIGGLGRVSDPNAQAQSIPRVLKRTQAFGSTVAGAGAFQAAATFLSGDTSGLRAGAFSIELAKQLSENQFGIAGAEAELAAASAVTIESGALGQRQVDRIGAAEADLARRRAFKARSGERRAGLSTQDRIALLQENPDLAAEFIAGSSLGQFEGIATEILLEPQGTAANTFREFLTKIPQTAAGQRAEGAAQLAGQLVDPLRGRVLQSQAIEGAITGQLLRQPVERLTTEDRTNIKQLGQLFGSTNFDARARDRLAELSGDPSVTLQESLSTLRSLEEFARAPSTIPGAAGGLGVTTAGVTPQGLGDPVLADKILAVLEGIESSTKEQTEFLKSGEGGFTAGPQ